MSDTRKDLVPESGFDYNNNPSWKIFRIMSEFVEGFSFLSNIQNSVTFFGSARLKEDHPYYQLARQLGKRLAEEGFTVVTGGGPGIMQAGNQGATEGGGNSIGLNIQLPMEQRSNPYVKQGISFNYFFSRKTMLDFSAEAYVFFPGGFGTLDEFFDLITLVQTGKMEQHVPIITMGREFWEPLGKWMEESLLNKLQAIAETDLKLWTVSDDVEEVVRLIKQSATQQAQTNKRPKDKLRQATRRMSETEQ